MRLNRSYKSDGNVFVGAGLPAILSVGFAAEAAPTEDNGGVFVGVNRG
jgi:hypothetical protein